MEILFLCARISPPHLEAIKWCAVSASGAKCLTKVPNCFLTCIHNDMPLGFHHERGAHKVGAICSRWIWAISELLACCLVLEKAPLDFWMWQGWGLFVFFKLSFVSLGLSMCIRMILLAGLASQRWEIDFKSWSLDLYLLFHTTAGLKYTPLLLSPQIPATYLAFLHP